MKNKEVEKCGWAGSILWVCTKDNYSIHLYDAPTVLNSNEVEIGADINSALKGRRIKGVKVEKECLVVTFYANETLSIKSEKHETARFFKQKGTDAHCVYENSELVCD